MITTSNLLALVAAYLLGSVPTAVWIGKAFYGIDVREHGSGNAGATNTFRVLGRKAGIPVLIIDILKGWASVNLSYLIGNYTPGTEAFINFQLALAIGALIGHIFPVYVGFRGGKGIATLLGIGIAIHPYAAFLCFGIFFLMLLISSYVSLSSIVAGISFPLIVVFLFRNKVPSLTIFALSVAAMVIITHQKNIERLLKGNESKTSLFKPKDKSNR
jgi:acyl phosphate:glycerol-3-phosphate acyltransferase